MAYRKYLPPPPTYADEAFWLDNRYDVASRLIRTAWSMLLSVDAAAITFSDLAREVGVSSPSAYNHFRDRAHLFGEIAGGALLTLAYAVVDSWPQEQIPLRAAPELCRIWLAFAEKRPRHYALMFSREFNDAERFPLVCNRRGSLKAIVHRVAETELGFDPEEKEMEGLLFLVNAFDAQLEAIRKKRL